MDIQDGVYEAADIYTFSITPVAGVEKGKLENRMK
jgi:hypothetical protein